MTLPLLSRIFFAIDLPGASKAKMGEYLQLLKKRSKTHAIRWSKPENLHITLQFLAEVQTRDVGKLLLATKHELRAAPIPPPVNLSQLTLFPTALRPRVIVASVRPQSHLAEISTRIGYAIKGCGYEVENRLYRPHMTLGRLKYSQGLDLSFLNSMEPIDIPPISLAEVVLFRSEPQPEGSRYEVIERIPLLGIAV